MKKFNTVVFGLTAFATGFSYKNKNVLIIEKSYNCAVDFCTSQNPVALKTECKNEIGQKLLTILTNHNAVSSDGAYLNYSLSGALASLLAQTDATVIFGAFVTKITKETNGYNITYFSDDGYETVFANRIIDTNSLSVLNKFPLPQKINKYLSFMAENVAESVNYFCDNIRIIPSIYQNEKIIQTQIPLQTDYVHARQLVFAVIKKFSEKYSSALIASVANDFAYEYYNVYKVNKLNYYFIPSVSFGNALNAICKGAELCY